ncbi:hypothetical protein BD779DRAFT_1508164 [Infundibulicybe gibba]|nr:hypothetical protein BD779DRAFT_1508164 [Infundibulicybe gibba]
MDDNTFNLVIGVLALISAAASTFGYYHSRLPSQRMDTFDEILGRTKTLFVTAKEDGLIAGPLQRTINARIKTLESSSLEARALAYGPAQSLGVGLIRRGLPQKIEALIVEARALRLFVAVSDM